MLVEDDGRLLDCGCFFLQMLGLVSSTGRRLD